MRSLPARWIWLSIGLIFAILPVLPIPFWVGAPDPGPAWPPYLERWSLGLMIVTTIALLVGRLTRGLNPRWRRLPRLSIEWILAGLVVLGIAGGLVVMHLVFAGNPQLVDEIAQLFHARAFATGQLGAPVPQPAESFLLTHTFVAGEAWVSQYPPGHTALLALGFLVNAEWLVNPVMGGLAAIPMYVIGRALYGPKTGLVAAVLWVLSSWVVFMSGTYMNHVSGLTLTLVAWAAVFGAKRGTRPWYLVAGAALAAVAAIRPLDAVAAALPILVWFGLERQWRAGVWLAVGGAPILIGLLMFNGLLFGHPLTFGYNVLYGPEHGLGFHVDPYGEPYTPLVALSNAASAIRRLNIYLFEWPIPALLPFVLWAVLAPHRRQDLIVAACVLSAPLLYFFYWHSGYYLGPRFYFAAVPGLVLGTARSWRWLMSTAKRLPVGAIDLRRTLVAFAAVTVVWGWLDLVPARADVYRDGLRSMKLHPERALADAGVTQALVIVPESWASRTIVGLWALGVPAGTVERAFRRLDTCDLHDVLQAARTHQTTGEGVTRQLEKLVARAVTPAPRVEDAPDPWLRLFPRRLPDHCRLEFQRDLTGFSLYGSLGWRNAIGLNSGIVFARDLFERNDALFAQFPGWEIWRWAPPPGEPDATPQLRLLQPGGWARAP